MDISAIVNAIRSGVAPVEAALPYILPVLGVPAEKAPKVKRLLDALTEAASAAADLEA